MTTTIVKWGNSQGIRLPKAFLQNINVSENETVNVVLENEAIIIKKMCGKKHRTTRERLVEFGQDTSYDQQEIDWGKPDGSEIWQVREVYPKVRQNQF
jgi:antitoxin MazE